MGCFSWLDCKSQEPVRIGSGRTVYVLVPKKFQRRFGKKIETGYYDGYGNFNGYDIYELVAIWNRAHLSEDMLEEAPKPEGFTGLWSFEIEHMKKEGKSDSEIDALNQKEKKRQYEAALDRWEFSRERLKAFRNGESKNKLAKKYGDDWCREIGISIAGIDEQNEKLPYPIKITYDKDAVYEDCGPSYVDEGQGCY